MVIFQHLNTNSHSQVLDRYYLQKLPDKALNRSMCGHNGAQVLYRLRGQQSKFLYLHYRAYLVDINHRMLMNLLIFFLIIIIFYFIKNYLLIYIIILINFYIYLKIIYIFFYNLLSIFDFLIIIDIFIFIINLNLFYLFSFLFFFLF